jgi:sialic acid synthase SpsE
MTFIVAEVGSNYTCKQDLFDSIDAAKEAGSDCVKFQLYSHKELYGIPNEIVETHDGYGVVKAELRMPGELPREWVAELYHYCNATDIEFMCTPFSPEGVEFLYPFLKRIKIASSEITHRPLLEAAARTDLPVILSTGGASEEQISEALDILGNDPRTTLLYCVAAYPAEEILPQRITRLRKLYGIDVGYSCHTDNIRDAVVATGYGATIIEKHFKLRDMLTPDNGHSVTPDEFGYMVKLIRQLPGLLAQLDPQEDEMRSFHQRRYIPELGGYYRVKK